MGREEPTASADPRAQLVDADRCFNLNSEETHTPRAKMLNAPKAAKAIAKAAFWLAFLWALVEAGILLPTGRRSPQFADAFRQALAIFGTTYVASAALYFLHSARRDAGDWFLMTLFWAISLAAIPFFDVDWRWYAPDIVQDAWDAYDKWHFNAVWLFVGVLALGMLVQILTRVRELAQRLRSKFRGSARNAVLPGLNGRRSDQG